MLARRHDKHFTPKEANSLLPVITPLLVRIQRAVELHQKQLKAALYAGESARTNGKKHEPLEPDALIEIEDLTARVQEYGCIIKSHAEGLVDFPAILEGREVYLCWRLGESRIEAWHELEEGFAGRQPVIDDMRFETTM